MQTLRRLKDFVTGRISASSPKTPENIQRLILIPNGYMLLTKDSVTGKVTAVRTDEGV